MITNDFNKLGLIYFNVSAITFLYLEPLWETGENQGNSLKMNAYNTDDELNELNKILVHKR